MLTDAVDAPEHDSSLPRGREGRYAKGVARRQEILERAIELFAERGAKGTSLRKIAEAIGVSHAALLHYFDSREQLLVEVYRVAEERELLLNPLPAEGSAIGLMSEAAQRNLRIPGLVQLYSTLVASALEEGHDEARLHFEQRFRTVRADMVSRIEADQASGVMRDDVSAHSIAALAIAASDGLQTQWLLDPSVDLVRSLQDFERLLLR